MRTLGLDASTSTGVCALGMDYENGWAHLSNQSCVVEFKKKTGWDRAQSIAVRVGELCDEWKPDVAIIEGYSMRSMARSGLTTVKLIEIGTLIRQALFTRRIPWYVVPPSTLKAYATGRGNAKKPEIGKAVFARWGFKSPSHDVVDAYVLARMGHVILSNKSEGGMPLKGVHCEYQRVPA